MFAPLDYRKLLIWLVLPTRGLVVAAPLLLLGAGLRPRPATYAWCTGRRRGRFATTRSTLTRHAGSPREIRVLTWSSRRCHVPARNAATRATKLIGFVLSAGFPYLKPAPGRAPSRTPSSIERCPAATSSSIWSASAAWGGCTAPSNALSAAPSR